MRGSFVRFLGCALLCIAVSPAVAQDTEAQRKAQIARWESELEVLQRRRDVVRQRVEALIRRRIAHDLLIPLTDEELLRGIPAGDPMQREALEKSLADTVEKTRELRATLLSLRTDAARLADDVTTPTTRRATQIPAAPGGPGIPTTDVRRKPDPVTKIDTEVSPTISPAVRRFDLVPRADESRDGYLKRALPFAFDEVASTIPTVESAVRTAPGKNTLRRVWTLTLAGMHRRALEVIRAHHPAEDERPFALRFLEARALEGLGLVAESEAIYRQIVELDVKSVDAAPDAAADAAAEKTPGAWSLASEAALQALRFERRFPLSQLPETKGLRW